MIGKLTYDQVIEVANQLKMCAATISDLIVDKQAEDLQNFVSVVDRYIKFLETTVELYKDADKALINLTNKK
mgnify:FL=1